MKNNKSKQLIPSASDVLIGNIKKSHDFLLSKKDVLSKFDDIDHFGFSLVSGMCTENLNGIEYNFLKIRNKISSCLHKNEIYIGPTVLDSLLFSAIKLDTSQPVEEVFKAIKRFGLHRPGFILYPLHSFGILGAGFYSHMNKANIYYSPPNTGIAISPQNNSVDRLLRFLKNASKQLGIRGEIPVNDLEHYIRSRPLDWVTHNPIIMVSARSYSGTYYENQSYLLVKLHFAKSFIFMLHSLENASEAKISSIFGSTSRVNNFQTLDFYHYLIFQTPIGGRKYLNLECTPMNISRIELTTLADCNATIMPTEWNKRNSLYSRICNACQSLERLYVRHCLATNKTTTLQRVLRKLRDSLSFYCRSFSSNDDTKYQIINLSIAFESLLCDYYAHGVTDRLVKHLKSALKGIPGTREMQDSLQQLYKCRCSIVHTGNLSDEVNLILCRKAFVFSFIKIVENLDSIKHSRSNEPIKDILDV